MATAAVAEASTPVMAVTPSPAGTSARDPVCGMDVASEQGYTKMYGGRDYRVCSRACLDKFEEHPDPRRPFA